MGTTKEKLSTFKIDRLFSTSYNRSFLHSFVESLVTPLTVVIYQHKWLIDLFPFCLNSFDNLFHFNILFDFPESYCLLVSKPLLKVNWVDNNRNNALNVLYIFILVSSRENTAKSLLSKLKIYSVYIYICIV